MRISLQVSTCCWDEPGVEEVSGMGSESAVGRGNLLTSWTNPLLAALSCPPSFPCILKGVTFGIRGEGWIPPQGPELWLTILYQGLPSSGGPLIVCSSLPSWIFPFWGENSTFGEGMIRFYAGIYIPCFAQKKFTFLVFLLLKSSLFCNSLVSNYQINNRLLTMHVLSE